GVADSLVLPETRDIARLDIRIDSERYVHAEGLHSPLTAFDASFIPHDFSPRVTGVVRNSLNRSITNVRVSAILFDSEGKIIGGGSETVAFVPPGAPIGVEINVATRGDPASVRLFTSFYEHSIIESSSGMNRPLTVENLHDLMSINATLEEKLKLVAVGVVQDAYGNANFGFVVENPDRVLAFHLTSYQAAAYDASGRVIGVASGIIPLTFPGEKMGVDSSLQVPEGSRIDRLEIVIDQQSADGLTLPGASPLASERAAFIPSALQPKATGIIKNSMDKAIAYVPVSAIAYDDQGEIIGVGQGYISSVPANGESVADIYMHSSAEPASVELYPQITDPLAIRLYTP
ncbi:MAG: hypothetical protein GKC10_01035, partial [Methanosarcinales archaeon]|nr:hypothetical protein [Methanosarcinales archaeon]